MRTYGIGDELSSPARNGTLLDNNGALTSVLSNNTSDGLESSHVGGATSTDTTVLGRSVDSDENDIGLANAGSNISAEEKVARTRSDLGLGLIAGGGFAARGGLVGKGGLAGTITGNADNVVQTGLVDGRML